MSRDRNDRPSWREIDQKRDGRSGGGKAQRPKEKGGKGPNRYQQKQIDRAFDSLFTNPERDKGLETIRAQVGKEGFADAVEAFCDEFGFPESYDVLQLILEEHPDPSRQAQALEAMDGQVDDQADSTQQVFRSRVKLLRMTAKDAQVRKLAGRIAKRRKL